MPDIDAIMAWEEGTLDTGGTFELFAGMIRDGSAWTFQGTYGRTAALLIEDGVITREGEITDYGRCLIAWHD